MDPGGFSGLHLPFEDSGFCLPKNSESNQIECDIGVGRVPGIQLVTITGGHQRKAGGPLLQRIAGDQRFSQFDAVPSVSAGINLEPVLVHSAYSFKSLPCCLFYEAEFPEL